MSDKQNIVKYIEPFIGQTFYSRAFGAVVIRCVTSEYITANQVHNRNIVQWDCYGYISTSGPDAEMDLFPSKAFYDWDKWYQKEVNRPRTWASSKVRAPKELHNVVNILDKHCDKVSKSCSAHLKLDFLIQEHYNGYGNFVIKAIGKNLEIQSREPNDKMSIGFKYKCDAEKFLSSQENIDLVLAYYQIF